MDATQPDRGPADGEVSITRCADGTLCVSVTHDGGERSLLASEYNAWRIFGMLAIMLGIELPRRIARKITLSA